MVRFHLLPPVDTLRGGITQLVEWLLCKQHVAGSNPTTSTSRSRTQQMHRFYSIFENRMLEVKENCNVTR